MAALTQVKQQMEEIRSAMDEAKNNLVLLDKNINDVR